jgi:uncharacterized protein
VEPQTSAGMAKLLIASGTPIVLLVVLGIRFLQVRRRRARARRAAAATPSSSVMRRRDRAITDPTLIEAIVSSASICRLGLTAANEPYIVPMNFGVAGSVSESMELDPAAPRFVVRHGAECRLYFHAATAGRKLEMMRTNKRACFEIEGRSEVKSSEGSCEWTMLFESIIGYGNLSEVSDPSEKRRGLESIMRHYGAEGPFDFPDSMINGIAVISLEITELTGKSNLSGEES